MKQIKDKLTEYWLLVLLIIQPVLDVVAYVFRSESGTVSGYIRLAVMAALVIGLVLDFRSSKKYVYALACFGLVFFLHVINCFIHGYAGLINDLKNIVRIAFLPVTAICLCYYVNNEKMCSQVLKGITINFFIEAGIIVLAYITGTYTSTYSEGFGISGWVIQDNRCCHSDILAAVCIFAGGLSMRAKKIWVNIALPLCIFLLLITNGTRACYVSLFAVMAGFPLFAGLKAIIEKSSLNKNVRITCFTMALLFGVSILVYPLTPRNKIEEYKRLRFDSREQDFVKEMSDLGYDIYNISLEEKMSDPVVHDKLVYYYKTFVYGEVDILGRRYDFDRIIRAYDGTINSHILGDTRDMKNIYVGFVFEDSDLATRFTGIEHDAIGIEKANDLENDWYALLYYTGYLGLAFFTCACLYIIFRLIRLLRFRFNTSLTVENFCLLMCFLIELGLGYFSGQIFRRPNAAVYLCAVISAIFCLTTKHAVTGENNEA